MPPLSPTQPFRHHPVSLLVLAPPSATHATSDIIIPQLQPPAPPLGKAGYPQLLLALLCLSALGLPVSDPSACPADQLHESVCPTDASGAPPPLHDPSGPSKELDDESTFVFIKHGGEGRRRAGKIRGHGVTREGPHVPSRLFSDNQHFLVNTNCTIVVLLHYIRGKLGLAKTGEEFGEGLMAKGQKEPGLL